MLRTTVSRWILVMAFLMVAGASVSSLSAQSQAPDTSDLNKMVENGEFVLALDIADKLGDAQAQEKNHILQKVASAQYKSGANSAAVKTLSLQGGGSNQIADGFRKVMGQGPAANFQQLGGQIGGGIGGGGIGGFGNGQTGNGFGNGQNGGQFGGGAQADFTSLMNLIQSTITPDQWDTTGDASGQTMIPFPNGVLVDAKGLMRFQKQPKTQSFLKSTSKQLELVSESELRMISLPKLEQQLMSLAATGSPVPDSLRYLGGMYDIHYVTIDKNSGDLFLVGPAGPWDVNSDGIAVNKKTGKAVLHLDDLVVALRSTQDGKGVFGCSIDSRKGQYEQFNAMASRLRRLTKGRLSRIAAAVGPSDANIFGVPSQSHAAWAMLAADYHMKLLAMGNLPSIPSVPDYISLCGNENTQVEKIRWWFTLGKPVIQANADQTEYKISGSVIKLKTENQVFRGRAPRISIPATKFVNNFNRNFQKVAAQYPLYGQLENLFELSIAAQILKTNRLDQKVNWKPTFLMGTDPNFGYSLKEFPVPKEVALVVQMKKIPTQRAGRAASDIIISVSGGVTAKIDEKFVKKNTQQTDRPVLSYQLSEQLGERNQKVEGIPSYLQAAGWKAH